MIIFRCDICKNETAYYRNLALTRKLIDKQNVVEETKPFSFDVCSDDCEKEAFKKILANFVKYEDLDIEVTVVKDE